MPTESRPATAPQDADGADVEAATLPLAAIVLGDNVRELDLEHVDNLAGSIKLRGLISPLTVRPIGDGQWQLVAGHHRHAACVKLGLTEVTVTRTVNVEGTSGDAAAENVLRKQLNPLEEAYAVKRMLDDGYTPAGAAAALGWPQARVTQRAKILRLPEAARALVGDGRIPLRGVDALLTIQDNAPDLCALLVRALVDEHVDGGQLTGNLGWAIGAALRAYPDDAPFAANLSQVHPGVVDELKLGKKAKQQLADAEAAHRKLDRYAYGPPIIRFASAHVDQARAAGVLLELDGMQPIITDPNLYRELCKQAIADIARELTDRVIEAADEKRQERAEAAQRPKSPTEQAVSEHNAQGREFARQAHGVNLDLGAALMTELATVDPADMRVAKFYCYGLLGAEPSGFMGGRDNTALTLAANGLRLVLDEHRTTDTPTLKSGQPGKTKVTYADPDDALAWLWRFVDGAKTPGELYGRTMVVFAAQHYAQQIALPNSKRRSSILPASHKNTARKAFEQVTKTVLPVSYKQLTRAIAREANAHHKQLTEARDS